MDSALSILVGKIVKKKKYDDSATGRKAKVRRDKLKMSLREAGKLAGCSFSYIADLEAGRRSWTGKKAQDYAKLLEK